jgi:hypothetical protein
VTLGWWGRRGGTTTQQMPRPARSGLANTHTHTTCHHSHLPRSLSRTAHATTAAPLVMTRTDCGSSRVRRAGLQAVARAAQHGEMARVQCAWYQKGGELQALCTTVGSSRLHIENGRRNYQNGEAGRSIRLPKRAIDSGVSNALRPHYLLHRCPGSQPVFTERQVDGLQE